MLKPANLLRKFARQILTVIVAYQKIVSSPVTFPSVDDTGELVKGGWVVGCTKLEVSVLFDACVASEVLEGD